MVIKNKAFRFQKQQMIRHCTNIDTKIFRPNVISRRISAQSGAFTVHKFIENNSPLRHGVARLDTNRDFKELGRNKAEF